MAWRSRMNSRAASQLGSAPRNCIRRSRISKRALLRNSPPARRRLPKRYGPSSRKSVRPQPKMRRPMPTEMVHASKPTLTLYELEDSLAALANTFEMVEGAEGRHMILEDIGRALCQAREKRDALAGVLLHSAARRQLAAQGSEAVKAR